MPEELQKRSSLLEYDMRWATREEFSFFDFNKGVQEMKHLLGQFDLCVIDPPYIDKKVWVKYFDAAQGLLKPGGHVLLTSIPENEPMLKTEWCRLERGVHLTEYS